MVDNPFSEGRISTVGGYVNCGYKIEQLFKEILHSNYKNRRGFFCCYSYIPHPPHFTPVVGVILAGFGDGKTLKLCPWVMITLPKSSSSL